MYGFVYLGSTISVNLSLETELNRRIGKAATTLSRLTKRLWTNGKQTEHTKAQVYIACVVSTLLYEETQRRLRWLGHVTRMEDGRIPKDLLYGELALGKRPIGRPQLRFKDVCKRDLKVLGINTDTWEAVASDRAAWKHTVQDSLAQLEEDNTQRAREKRRQRKEQPPTDRPATCFICAVCGRVCHSRIGLHSHSRRCSQH